MKTAVKRIEKRIETIKYVYTSEQFGYETMANRYKEVESALYGAVDLDLITIDEFQKLKDKLYS